MPVFGTTSKSRLWTCDDRLQRVMNRAISIVPGNSDFTILCGHRGEEEQTKAFISGTSTVTWPNSNHNKTPSKAVDIAPYPIDWDDITRFNRLATYIFKAAMLEGVEIHWGGHWRNFKDYPHYEVKD